MPNDDFETRIRPRRKFRRVRLDHSNPEAAEESAERFFGQFSQEALEARVMPLITKYFYVWGITKEGKKAALGPFYTAQEADQRLAALDDGEIFELETKDLTKATRIMKAEMMRRGEDADKALERVKHKP